MSARWCAVVFGLALSRIAAAAVHPGDLVAITGAAIRVLEPPPGADQIVSGSFDDGVAALDFEGKLVAIDPTLSRLVRIDLDTAAVVPFPYASDASPINYATVIDLAQPGVAWIATGRLIRFDLETGERHGDPFFAGSLAVEPTGSVVFPWRRADPPLRGGGGLLRSEGMRRFEPVGGTLTDVLPPLYTDDDAVELYANRYPAVTPNGTLFVSIGGNTPRIARVDLVLQARIDVSGPGQGTGPALVDPERLLAETDDALLVFDAGTQAIVSVDVTTGDRTIVSGGGVGSGPQLTDLIDLEPTGSILARVPGAIARVDRATGDRTVIFTTSIGTGAPLGWADLAVDCTTLIVTVAYPQVQLGSVDPVTGDRATIAGFGPYGTLRIADRCDGEGRVWALIGSQYTDFPSLVRVDPASGGYEVVSGPTAGSGPLWSYDYAHVAWGPTGVFVTDRAAIIRVDPVSGERSIVSDESHGAGDLLPDGLADIAIAPSGELFVTGTVGLWKVDPVSGDRVRVSGTETDNPLGLTVGADGAPIVSFSPPSAFEFAGLDRIDPETGQRTRIAYGYFGGFAVVPEPDATAGFAAALCALASVARRRQSRR